MNHLPSEKYSEDNCATCLHRDFPNPDLGARGVLAVELFQGLETGNTVFSKPWKKSPRAFPRVGKRGENKPAHRLDRTGGAA